MWIVAGDSARSEVIAAYVGAALDPLLSMYAASWRSGRQSWDALNGIATRIKFVWIVPLLIFLNVIHSRVILVRWTEGGVGEKKGRFVRVV